MVRGWHENCWGPNDTTLCIRALTGKGYFSKVYEAYFQGIPVAVKLLKIEFRDLNRHVEREVQALRHLLHDNVIRIIAARRVDMHYPGQMAMIMERALGGTLESALTDDDEPAYNSQSTTFQIASGLAYLHDNDLIHRDLKPANVLFKDKARKHVALGDLGSKDETSHLFFLREPALFQAVDAQRSQSSDVYSLAIVACAVMMRDFPENRYEIETYFLPDLKERYPGRYRVICQAIFGHRHERPSAKEFREEFNSSKTS